ncbi:MAG: neutral/alkaline non-lysosomal ceramidase N-terminal domain-containing protein [Terriglobia bacterium]
MIKSGKAVKRPFGWYLALLVFVLSVLGSGFSLRAAQFRASVVKIDITPDKSEWLLGYGPRQSTGVHDRLFHRIVAMDDGTTQFYLISTDICLISPSVYDDVTKEIEKQTGIKPLQIWWTTTHTHAAPEVGPPGLGAVFMGERYEHDHNTEYSAWVEQKLIDGVKEARAKLEPARLGVGWGMAMANINRRARDKEGEAFLGLNPDGPADRQIGLLRLEKADGSLLALVANYAMHGTVLGDENKIISADAPGIVADYVEEQLGAPMLYINGAAGNMAPIYTVYQDFESGHLSQFRVLLGDKIIAANRLIGPATSDVRLALGETTVETPRRAGLGWAKDIGKYSRTTSGGQNLVLLPVRFLRINNDIAVWSAPIELFCEVAMNVRSQSPFPYTFYFGYANGWLGYMPTKAEFAYGGYEPKTSPYTDQAEGDLTRTVVTYLQGQVR